SAMAPHRLTGERTSCATSICVNQKAAESRRKHCMTRTLGLAITLVLGAISTFSVGAAAQPAQGEPYKIGIILPMTGTTADYGADFNRGALLAEEEINAAGGIKGHPIKLVHGDSKNQPKDGVAEFKRLVEIEKVPAVIST